MLLVSSGGRHYIKLIEWAIEGQQQGGGEAAGQIGKTSAQNYATAFTGRERGIKRKRKGVEKGRDRAATIPKPQKKKYVAIKNVYDTRKKKKNKKEEEKNT